MTTQSHGWSRVTRQRVSRHPNNGRTDGRTGRLGKLSNRVPLLFFRQGTLKKILDIHGDF